MWGGNEPLMRMPYAAVLPLPVLPEIRLRAAGVVPPIVLPTVSTLTP